MYLPARDSSVLLHSVKRKCINIIDMEPLKTYSAPSCEVLEVEGKALICVSGPDYGDGGDLDFIIL